MGLVSFAEEARKLASILILACKDSRSLQPRKGPAPESNHAGTLVPDLQLLEPGETNFCCF